MWACVHNTQVYYDEKQGGRETDGVQNSKLLSHRIIDIDIFTGGAHLPPYLSNKQKVVVQGNFLQQLKR